MKSSILAAALIIAGVAPLAAQEDVHECSLVVPSATCFKMFTAAEISQVRSGIALSGGNPIMGASSTLGMRLGAIPRVTIAARMTGARLEMPDLETPTSTETVSSLPRSLNVDASIGVFSGLSLFPTVGGFGSIDLIASYGKLSLPDGDGFTTDPSSFAGGVRVGILRESFTAPGISVTAMYRKIGDIENEHTATGAFRLTNNSAVSLRGTVGKRLLMLGATVGVGYDSYSSELEAFGPISVPPTSFAVSSDDFKNSRTTLFANLSWTMLVLHIVGEGGVQRGGDEDALFGSLAVRLAL